MMAAYLTAKQVAERLQVSVSWVYKHKRLLGAVQIGERIALRLPPPPSVRGRHLHQHPPWHLKY